MNVTPAQAGVQFKDAWIPACAGMTDRYHASYLNNVLNNISGTPHKVVTIFQATFHEYCQNYRLLETRNLLILL
jgi:hypothetical protein